MAVRNKLEISNLTEQEAEQFRALIPPELAHAIIRQTAYEVYDGEGITYEMFLARVGEILRIHSRPKRLLDNLRHNLYKNNDLFFDNETGFFRQELIIFILNCPDPRTFRTQISKITSQAGNEKYIGWMDFREFGTTSLKLLKDVLRSFEPDFDWTTEGANTEQTQIENRIKLQARVVTWDEVLQACRELFAGAQLTRQKGTMRMAFQGLGSSKHTLSEKIVQMILDADNLGSFFNQYSHEFNYDNRVPIRHFGNTKFLRLKQVIERCLQKGSI